ncbi:hypothetical protein SRABI118_01006 [Massilia sp. Bi118]|uniref:S41 family peptidase n=1 Tax=Massilia sp. Bi118 TaxID=2822346 RepID=UPI001D491EF8|nr:S41 family peptidase [Massilia sp. Bi118]CAH0171473.1 hypothetical protein SRABI118_01006 [Massilia sp. Bi118]
MKKKWFAIPAAVVLGLLVALLYAPELARFWLANRPQPTLTIDAAMRTQTIDALAAKLNQHYMSPEKAREIEALLRERQKRGAYDAIGDAEKFAEQLEADITGVSHDLHMGVGFSSSPLPPDPSGEPDLRGRTPPPDAPLFMRVFGAIVLSRENFGIAKVEHLSPGVGFLQLTGFAPPVMSADRVASAMNKLADTDALIIDLRGNRGGHPGGVNLMLSYFVDQRTHVNDIWSRNTGSTTELWTEDRLEGKRYGGKKPVFILVDRDTMSAGENFAYTMQALKRATIIGTRTWGGAHPGRPYRLGDHFYALVPDARIINPITHTDWEGTGVLPDVEAAPADALKVAQELLQRQTRLTALR